MIKELKELEEFIWDVIKQKYEERRREIERECDEKYYKEGLYRHGFTTGYSFTYINVKKSPKYVEFGRGLFRMRKFHIW